MGRAAAAWCAWCVLIGAGCGAADGGWGAGGGSTDPVAGGGPPGGGANGSTEAAATTPRVRIVYLVPSDRAFNPLYARNAQRAVAHVRAWYRATLGGGRTFRWSEGEVPVEHRFTAHPAHWYGAHALEQPPVYWWWYNAVHDGFALTGGRYGDPANRWIYLIDSDPPCGQFADGGTSGVAVLGADELRGLAGEPVADSCPDRRTPNEDVRCRWVGQLGHELGHAFGLAHPAGCDADRADCVPTTLMWTGYLDYPKTGLLAGDLAQLARSPFFAPLPEAAAPLDCDSFN